MKSIIDLPGADLNQEWAIFAHSASRTETQIREDLHLYTTRIHWVKNSLFVASFSKLNISGLNNHTGSQDHSPLSGIIYNQVTRSISQTQIPATKSETSILLTNHQSSGGTNSTMKSDKKSLASKLSGSLHRNNSGQY